MSFFVSEPTKLALPQQAACGVCGLWKSCKSPKMPVSGKGEKKILVVGEAPGADEDDKGIAFIGKSGSFLRDELSRVGIDLRQDCWVTNSVICRPPNNKLDKYPKAVEHCRPNLVNTIRELQPHVILLFGATPVRSLIGWLWKEDVGAIGRWVGHQIPSQEINSWICPNWHPAWLLRDIGNHEDYLGEEPRGDNETRKILFRRYLKRACSLKGRPWTNHPSYRDRISLFFDPGDAAEAIGTLTSRSGPFAFDYETNCLKPDGEQAQIVCCSISNGDVSIAYPWHGKAREATGRFLRSDKPKIAQNLQFEERWTIKEFGHGVRNWYWDTILATHTLDNRQGICDLKFQSFVVLGQSSYDDHIEPFLKGRTPNSPNRIKEIPLQQLMSYCATDSLLEYLVAQKQKGKFGKLR